VNNLLTGIDIGTQGTTCAVYDENGSQKAEAFQPSCLLYPSPDAVEEDPGTQFLSVISTIKSCVQQLGHEAGNIAAIAIDGQMAGIIGINADGKHITPYDSWLDTRCAPQIKQMNDAAAQKNCGGNNNIPVYINIFLPLYNPAVMWPCVCAG
jgi:xylulokinase